MQCPLRLVSRFSFHDRAAEPRTPCHPEPVPLIHGYQGTCRRIGDGVGARFQLRHRESVHACRLYSRFEKLPGKAVPPMLRFHMQIGNPHCFAIPSQLQ